MPRPDQKKRPEVFQPDSSAVRGMIAKRKARAVFRPPRGADKKHPGRFCQAYEALRCASSKCQMDLPELSKIYKLHADGAVYCAEPCGRNIHEGRSAHEDEAAEKQRKANKRAAAKRDNPAKRSTADA